MAVKDIPRAGKADREDIGGALVIECDMEHVSSIEDFRDPCRIINLLFWAVHAEIYVKIRFKKSV